MSFKHGMKDDFVWKKSQFFIYIYMYSGLSDLTNRQVSVNSWCLAPDHGYFAPCSKGFLNRFFKN